MEGGLLNAIRQPEAKLDGCENLNTDESNRPVIRRNSGKN
jgi:hypothetical protein